MHQNMQSESAFIVQSTFCCVNKARLPRLSSGGCRLVLFVDVLEKANCSALFVSKA